MPKTKDIAMGFNTMNICNTQIKRVREANYLGLILDENHTFSSHIDYLLKTLIKYAIFFKMIINHVPTICKLQLYYANMYFRVLYGIEIFGNTSCNNDKRIQTVQNKCLKTLFNLKWDTSTNELHHNLKVLKVCDVFKIRISEFEYKSIHNILPNVFPNYNQTVNEIP